ncbi:MAG: tetratricopeptide repeat protein, partial [Crocosphaera sp.]
MLEPLPKLTEAFLESLKLRKKPVVLVFDTYEKVSPDIDGWLWKYLIGNANFIDSNVYVIIAGRNNILKNESWRKLQQDTQLIYEGSLERFDEEQTRDYLQQININNSDTIEEIFKITKGLPYYLDKIRERIKRGETIDYSQLNQDIVSLLLQGLNNTQKQVISMAACCRWFDKQVIKYLIDQKENLYFNSAVDEKINCYEWLKKRDFVEYIKGKYRLDDVAKDVFRQEFWREDKQQFRLTHQQLADYFKQKRNEQIFPNSSPAQQYNNPLWRDDTREFLYHQLYAGKANSEIELISHLFTSRYFKQDEIVQVPVGEIINEVDIYSDENAMLVYPLRQCLRDIIPAVFAGYGVLEECPLDYEYFEQYNLVKADIDKAITRCFRHLNQLSGMAKFAALVYKSKRCYPSQQLSYLQAAKAEAEIIATEDDPEFSSDLFLWSLGNEFVTLEANEEEVNCYQIAVKFKPDKDEAWYNRGIALGNLGRHEDAIASYDKALEFKPDKDEA